MVRIEIRGNKFYADDTSYPTDDSRGLNQYNINIQKRGGKWRIYYDTNPQSREYDLADFVDGMNGDAAFATDQALTDWFDVNTGNKTGGGTGQSAAQVQAAINADHTTTIRETPTATDDDTPTEKAVRDALDQKLGIPTVTLPADEGKILVVDNAGNFVLADAPEGGNDAGADWVGGKDYTGANYEQFLITPTQATPIDIDGNTLITGKPILMRYQVPKVANATLTLAEIALMEQVSQGSGTSTIADSTDVDNTNKAVNTVLRIGADGVTYEHVPENLGTFFESFAGEFAALTAFEQSQYTNTVAFGTYGDQNAAGVPIADVGGNFTSNEVEGALAELAAATGSGVNLSTIPEYDSLALATAGLGVNQRFRWSQANLDGVTSPGGSQYGITK